MSHGRYYGKRCLEARWLLLVACDECFLYLFVEAS